MRSPVRTLSFVVAAVLGVALVAAGAAFAQGQGPLRFTLKTIDNDNGVRAVLEFSRKPAYDVRNDGRKVLVTLREPDTEPPFKKRDVEGRVLDKIKFIEGMRTSEIVFYTGADFGTFSTFEMGEPFRIVIDFRRRQQPQAAVRVPPPGGSIAPPGAPPQIPPAGPGVGQGAAHPGVETPSGPASPPAPGNEPPPKAAFRIVVDPGHGGDDDGAHGPSGLIEKDVTLDVARRLKGRITAGMDAEVVLTRDADRTVPLDERTAIANHDRADLFVSIHANSTRRGNASGSETYFLSYQATDDESRAVAAIENNTLGLDQGVQANSSLEMVLWDLAQSAFLKESSALAEMIQERLDDALGMDNRGIKQAPFRVLMGATMPAVLVEIAFISNPEEEKRLRETAFKERLAGAIFDSIKRFRDKFVQTKAR